jgi:Cu/Ag efflux protein CusF
MKLRNFTVLMLALGLVLGLGGLGLASADDNRPHEGKVINIDKDLMMLSVQGDKDDQWTLYWTETTKLKGDLTVEEVKVGDKVHFDYTEKDGKMWLTELKRTDKAKG